MTVTMAQVRATAKARDAWWTVLLVDPVALRLVAWSARHRWITPNRLTVVAFLVTVGAAAAYAQGSRWWLIAGAAAYHVAFVLDCVDGKLARLTGTGSVLGQWLDFMLDRIAVTICAVALFGGLYARNHDPVLLLLGAVVVFLNLFHQLNGQIMEGALRRAREAAGHAGTPAPSSPPPDARSQDPQAAGWFGRLRAALARHRIRADVFSAIEFQMAIFIVGPIVGLVVPVTAVACALLVAFEGAAVVKFALTARAIERSTPRPTVPEQPAAPAADALQPADGAGTGR